ncbi:AraC family transcriptional regulator [Amycolatopsis decaplanina]|uniref:AraC family transcriptional regulator n=1 Tax=Amycolatopsis decaplanina DSM 44594 TaxID=1284240 RepID=M2X1X0_9PSEU|nr:AraC family transcriptional regulator [Amycolatopsis decaplanina]EME55021.1 AraC family transcriptional regulator [Amycolatopsis decaplanina DSM 44594]
MQGGYRGRTCGAAVREQRAGQAGRGGPGAGTPHTLFEGDDVEALDEVVTGEFSPHCLRVGRGDQAPGRFRRLHRQGLALYELRWGVPVEIAAGELPDFYNIHLPLAGGGTVWVAGREVTASCSVAGPGMTLGMSLSAGADTLILCLPRAVVDSAVIAQTGEPPAAALRFAPALADGDPAVAAWLGTARAFARFTASPLAARSPLAAAHFEQALVHGLVDLQPHDHFATLPAYAHPALPRAVRRAMAYCEEHAGEPVSVADMAAAARVSLRTLQARFRIDFGATPAAYLRRVRLDRVHQDLLRIADGSASGTVAEVATRWGFTHLSRFAAYYREAYGQVPSRTAERRCSPPA